MRISAVAQGVWLGLSIAAPVGPIGTLVIRQSMRSGFRAGIVSGFGAALADLCYGILAASGVRLAAAYARPIGIVGGLILLWLAWRTWHEAPPDDRAGLIAGSERRAGTTFFLTLSNPMTILSFVAMISAVGADDPVLFVAGVFLGSMVWWIVLSSFSSWMAERIEIRMPYLNRAAAGVLAGFGLWAVVVKGLR